MQRKKLIQQKFDLQMVNVRQSPKKWLLILEYTCLSKNTDNNENVVYSTAL